MEESLLAKTIQIDFQELEVLTSQDIERGFKRL